MTTPRRLRRILGGMAALALALVLPALGGHAEVRSQPLAHPDGELTVEMAGAPARQVFGLRTRGDRDAIEIQLEAALVEGRIEVAVIDAAGRHRADLEGGASSRLQVETGRLRLVTSPSLDGEAPRGLWRVEVALRDARGHYTLRYHGFAPAPRDDQRADR